MLVVRHILFDMAIGNPFNRRFQVVLTDGGSLEIIAPDPIGGTAAFAEIAFGIGDPGPRIDGIPQFLLGQFLDRKSVV